MAIEDIIKKTPLPATIGNVRDVVKKLRTPNVRSLMKNYKNKLKSPILDVPTRRHSMCDMLERVIELKQFCEDTKSTVPELNLSNREWETMENVTRALQPAKYANKDLQLEQLTCGDFYGVWLKCKSETSLIKTAFSKSVLQCMKAREKFLYESNAFLAGIFLDPR